jgi:Flp pilus assembly protein TadG
MAEIGRRHRPPVEAKAQSYIGRRRKTCGGAQECHTQGLRALLRLMPKIIPRWATVIQRFGLSANGVAAIEFAMILPILAVMFLATLDGGRGIATYMKVRASTNALALIANQFSTIQSSDMTAIMGAIISVMAPYSGTPMAATISQIAIDSKGKSTISWSYSQGGTARAQGSTITIPAGLITNSSYLLLAETTYTFTPLFGLFSRGSLALSDNLYVTPRISNCINYPPQSVTQCVSG